MDEDNNEFRIHQGQNVKIFRNMRNMKQEEFARQIGVKQPVVTKLERQSIIEDAMLLKCAEVLGIPVDILKEFKLEEMLNNFIYNFDKIQNTNGAFSFSKDCSNTNNNYPIEKLMELHQENVELHERLLHAEKEKNALLEKMLGIVNR